MRASTASPCNALTQSGAPCQSPAMPNSAYCFHHDPARAVERLEARKRGGQARHGRSIGLVGNGAVVSVKTTGDVLLLLERTINDALSLENSLNRARTIAQLAIAFCKTLEVNELAERIAQLEAILKARTQ